jgi:hypothetical protein
LHSTSHRSGTTSLPDSEITLPMWFSVVTLIVWLAACVVPFLPFAISTSPLDAVLFNVPGDQGNWWHFLVGLPFFLAFPIAWLTIQSMRRSNFGTSGQMIFAIIAALAGIGTILVETPFLLHLAGTSDWQRFSVLGLGLGVLIVSSVFLVLRRSSIAPLFWSLASLLAAYLANISLCLVVYASAPGSPSTRSGWFVTMGLVCPMALELLWLLTRSIRPRL